ncbi:MAG: hypothetical protein AAFQ10_09055 [Pseudomonadota bacterium]
MTFFPPLDTRLASYDRYRGAVMVPCGKAQVAVTHEALEDWANRKLTPDEAVETMVEEAAMFRAIANATPAHDDIIMITQSILNSRSWAAQPYDDGPEDSGPIYGLPTGQGSNQ